MVRERIDALSPAAIINHVLGAVIVLALPAFVWRDRLGGPVLLAIAFVSLAEIAWFYLPRIYADADGMTLQWRIRRRRVLWTDIEEVFAFQTRLRIKYRETGVTIRLKTGEHIILPGCSAQFRVIGLGPWGNLQIERRQMELADLISNRSSVGHWRRHVDSDASYPVVHFRLVQGRMMSHALWISGTAGVVGGILMLVLMYIWGPNVGVTTIGVADTYLSSEAANLSLWKISYSDGSQERTLDIDAPASAFVQGERVQLVYAAAETDLATLPDARFDNVALRPEMYVWFGLIGGPLLIALGYVIARAIGSGYMPLERDGWRKYW